jgi:hypothetical protein
LQEQIFRFQKAVPTKRKEKRTLEMFPKVKNNKKKRKINLPSRHSANFKVQEAISTKKKEKS